MALIGQTGSRQSYTTRDLSHTYQIGWETTATEDFRMLQPLLGGNVLKLETMDEAAASGTNILSNGTAEGNNTTFNISTGSDLSGVLSSFQSQINNVLNGLLGIINQQGGDIQSILNGQNDLVGNLGSILADLANQLALLEAGREGPPGEAGAAGAAGADGVGVPSGGTAGDVLSKAVGGDYVTEWVTPQAVSGSLPVAGAVGQHLVKVGPADFQAGWTNLYPIIYFQATETWSSKSSDRWMVSGFSVALSGGNWVADSSGVITMLVNPRTGVTAPSHCNVVSGGVYRALRVREDDTWCMLVGESSSPGVRWAKISSSWTSGNTVSANPCDEDGANVDSGTGLTLQILSGSAAPSIAYLAAGQVVAYLPKVAANAGQIVSPRVLVRGTTSTTLNLTSDITSTTANPTSWTRGDVSGQGVSAWMPSRPLLWDGSVGQMVQPYRKYTWDSEGTLVSVGAEALGTLDFGPCTGGV